LLLYGGETLSRLTCGLFRPILHQVVQMFHEPRYSMPFFQRARPEAIINCSALVAAGMKTTLPDDLRTPISVHDLMAHHGMRTVMMYTLVFGMLICS